MVKIFLFTLLLFTYNSNAILQLKQAYLSGVFVAYITYIESNLFASGDLESAKRNIGLTPLTLEKQAQLDKSLLKTYIDSTKTYFKTLKLYKLGEQSYLEGVTIFGFFRDTYDINHIEDQYKIAKKTFKSIQKLSKKLIKVRVSIYDRYAKLHVAFLKLALENCAAYNDCQLDS